MATQFKFYVTHTFRQSYTCLLIFFAGEVGIYQTDHFTVEAKLPGLRMEARLPVTLL